MRTKIIILIALILIGGMNLYAQNGKTLNCLFQLEWQHAACGRVYCRTDRRHTFPYRSGKAISYRL